MPGVAYLRSQATPQAHLVRIPLASNAAIERLLGGILTATPRLLDGALPATDVATVASAQAVEAARLFLSGKEPAEIVAAMKGIRSNQGSRYQAALREVTALIREGVQASSRDTLEGM